MKKLVIIFVTVFTVNSPWAQIPQKVVQDLKLDIDPKIRSYTERIRGLNMDMVYVEGGSYTMGCLTERDGECKDDELPSHDEKVESFYISGTEVTQAQWAVIMSGDRPSFFKNCNDCPVEYVSWDDVQEFIEKLNSLTGLNYRLPTSVEWEYAARGGQHSRGYKYSGSNEIGDVAWYDDNAGSKTHAVGTLKPNELGLYDMCGNVYEWCSNNSSKDYSSPKNLNLIEVRGGSWYNYINYCRIAYCYYSFRLLWHTNIGFRLCRNYSYSK